MPTNWPKIAVRACGVALWLVAAVVALLVLVGTGAAATGGGPVRRTTSFLFSSKRSVAMDVPRAVPGLEAGTLVFLDRAGSLEPAGEVVALDDSVGAKTIRVELYPDAGLPASFPAGTTFTLYDARGTLEWTLSEVWSEKRRTEAMAKLGAFWNNRSNWLRTTLGPLFTELSRGVLDDAQSRVPEFLANKAPELQEFGEDLAERGKQRWLPILSGTLWPKVSQRLPAFFGDVARETWAALDWRDVFGGAASASYDGLKGKIGDVVGSVFSWPPSLPGWSDVEETVLSPITEAAKAALDKVLRTGEPIAKRRALALLMAVVDELVDDPTVKAAVRASLVVDLLGDPCIADMMKDALVQLVQENPKIRERFERLVEDQRLRRALYDLAEDAGPLVVRMGRLAILDESGDALHPAVAQLVRMRVLERGACWIGIRLGDGPPMASGMHPQVLLYSGTRREIWEEPLGVSAGEALP